MKCLASIYLLGLCCRKGFAQRDQITHCFRGIVRGRKGSGCGVGEVVLVYFVGSWGYGGGGGLGVLVGVCGLRLRCGGWILCMLLRRQLYGI